VAVLGDLQEGWVRRRLRAEGLRLVLPPFTVHIHSSIPVVADGLLALYARHEVVDEVDSFSDFHVSVNAQRKWFHPQCVFEMDGRQPFTPLAVGEAFAFFEWGLNWCVTGHCHQWITVHSAVLEKNGQAVLLPAPPGSGKSTLCAALMLHGWRLLSDEMALLDPLTGLITPSPRPVSLKNRSIDVIKNRAPGAVMGPIALDTLKGTVQHLQASVPSLAMSAIPAKPAAVVFPRYKAQAQLSATPRSKASTLVELGNNSFNIHVHGRSGFDALVQLVDGARCFDFEYSQLDEALPWFDALFANP
jgi:HprK-related kinase A